MFIPVEVQNSQLVQKIIPDGTYEAILYRIIQIGTIQERYKDQTKPVKKILLSFVIPGISVLVNGEQVPYLVHKEYTESLFSTAYLRRDLIHMYGYDFISPLAELGAQYDLTDALGKACLVTTRQRSYNTDKIVIDLVAFAPIPETQIEPENPMELQYLSFRNFDWVLFLGLSQRLRRKIESSSEFQAIPESARMYSIEQAKLHQAFREAEADDNELEFYP